MTIEPYKRTPVPRAVAWMSRHGRVRLENGRIVALADVPEQTTVYSDYSRVRPLAAGRGEIVCWNETPIRYVAEKDVLLIPSLAGTEDEHLHALARLRDALASYGAAGGSLASCSYSLLRATIARPIFTWGGPDPVPMPEVVGGRVVYGRSPGHVPTFTQIDISAAYASTLARLVYGGTWVRFDTLPPADDPLPWFGHAKVWVPKMAHGPLPKRNMRPTRPGPGSPRFASTLRKMSELRPYPVGGYVTGIWSKAELYAARDVGCDPKPDRGWLCMNGTPDAPPFAPWWGAIQELRALEGMAGELGKIVGNTLVGRFQSRGALWTIAWTPDNRTLYRRRAKDKGSRLPRFRHPLDIAELVTSTVRARLYTEAIIPAGDRLIAAHTDGALITEPIPLAEGWRTKHTGTGLVFLSPQTWAYPSPDGWVYTFSGVNTAQAPQAFSALAREILGRGWRSRKVSAKEEAWQATLADAI